MNIIDSFEAIGLQVRELGDGNPHHSRAYRIEKAGHPIGYVDCPSRKAEQKTLSGWLAGYRAHQGGQ